MQLCRESVAKWLTWARQLFIPVALGFLLYSAFLAGDRLAPLAATLSIRHLLLAWICWGVAQWIGPLTTLAFARILGLPLGYRELAMISVLRLPAKYLPGGIWQSVARFSAYSRHEVKKADSLTILIAEHLLALGVSAGLGAVLLLFAETSQSLHSLAAWVLTGASGVLAVTLMGLCRVWRNGIRTFTGLLISVLTTTLFWIAAATSFYDYWTAFGLQITDALRVASCYLLSWAAGFVTIFAPQGLGVFEWVAGELLPSNQPFSVTVMMVAGFRLVTIAADLSAWALAIALTRIGRNPT